MDNLRVFCRMGCLRNMVVRARISALDVSGGVVHEGIEKLYQESISARSKHC